MTTDVAVYTNINEARVTRGLKYLFQLSSEGLKEKHFYFLSGARANVTYVNLKFL